MARDYNHDGKVIKPPIESISSGRVFRPSRKLRYKYWFESVIMALFFWVATVLTFFGAIYLVYAVEGNLLQFEMWMEQMWTPLNTWLWILNGAWLIPVMIFIPVYLNSFEYSVRTESGESMPEIYVKKGIVTITRKHVPFRSITNVSTRAGPFDRLFRIGNIEIETAGYSGVYQEGPEEKIAGIAFYEELRDYILNELRKFREPYVLGTETPAIRDEGARDEELGGDQRALLREMREVKSILNDIRELLEKRRD
jgi:membrane protein YdbS with pleckstrin-like domain